MTTIQNDITTSDRNINNTVKINISEGNSSFWQKRKKMYYNYINIINSGYYTTRYFDSNINKG